jgi:2'-5' RNA ligase
MRLFLAVDLEAPAREAIARVADNLRARFGAADPALARVVKWVDSRHLHLTLHFLGEVDDRRAAGVVAAGAEPLAAAPFPVSFGGLGVFPPAGPSRVVWAGVTRGADGLSALHALVGDRVRSSGLPLESRPFSAHLTLGRFRDPWRGPLRSILDAAAQEARETPATTVSHVTLYQSRLGPGGPAYTALATAELRGAHVT